MDHPESLAWLYGLPRYAARRSLRRVHRLLAVAGHPERAFTPVAVAGTNGKGSVSAALASLLTAAGVRTGLYTSPHLHRFNERIRADGVEIPDDDVARLATRARNLVEKVVAEDAALAPAGFDAFTLLAFEWFRERDVDVAVLEAGMGGRLDATNAVPAAPVTVLTNVARDHAHALGDSPAAIAREKLALLKPGGTLVTAATQPDVLEVAFDVARRGNNPVRIIGEDVHVTLRESTLDGVRFDYDGARWRLEDLRFPLTGDHQALNAACAVAAAEVFEERGVAAFPEAAVRKGLASTRWPGRLEVAARDPLTLVDAAHNPAGAAATAKALEPLVAGRALTLVIGVTAEKPVTDIVRALLPLAHRVIATTPRERGVPPERVAAAVRDAGWRGPVDAVPDVADAVGRARADAAGDGVILVAGSVFLAAEARKLLKD